MFGRLRYLAEEEGKIKEVVENKVRFLAAAIIDAWRKGKGE
jgi:hypothetical protein